MLNKCQKTFSMVFFDIYSYSTFKFLKMRDFIIILLKNQMDLEFLTPEQLDLTLKLSDILSMQDLSVAAAVLASYDWNLQTALSQMQIGSIAPPVHNPYLEQNSQEQENLFDDDSYEVQKVTFEEKKKCFEQEHASLVPLQHTLSEPTKLFNLLEFHKMIAEDSKAHRGDYLLTLMKKSELVCKNILEANAENKKKYTQNREKIENNRQFINNFYKSYQPKINFTFGTFFLNLTRSYLQGKHLLVYIHSINPENQSKYDRVLNLIVRQRQIANFVNKNCITYGMFDNSDDYQILQKYVTPKELPAFAVFRMNKSKRQEEFVSSYVISTQKDIFLEWLGSSIGVKLTKKTDKNVTQVKQAKQNLHKEESNNKKKKDFNAHAYLRAQQDELYFQLEKTYNQKRQLSLQRREKIKQDEQNLLLRIKEAQNDKEPQHCPNVIQVRFRMPISGEQKSRRFLLTDKIEKCFIFIDCFCRDEFQQKFNNFQLIQTHPHLILSNFKQKTFEQIFEGSTRQNIMVRQI